jgi:uncharacterized membrane protein HdeD (DUF308 family)
MQTTVHRWVPFLIMFAATMVLLALYVKQAALLLWIIAMLAMISALVLALQQQPRSWWTVLIGAISAISGFSVFWWIVKSTQGA